MSEMRLGQVIDAIVTGLGATTGFRLSTTDVYTEATTVWDGPEWQVVDDNGPGGHVVIGYSGPRGGRSPSATTSWDAGPIAGTNRPRDEVTQLNCFVTAQRHATARGARNEAITIVSAVAAFCRADPSLGINTAGTIGGVRNLTFVTNGNVVQFSDRGFNCEIEFTITYKTRV